MLQQKWNMYPMNKDLLPDDGFRTSAPEGRPINIESSPQWLIEFQPSSISSQPHPCAAQFRQPSSLAHMHSHPADHNRQPSISSHGDRSHSQSPGLIMFHHLKKTMLKGCLKAGMKHQRYYIIPGWEARIIRCKNLALYIRDCESMCLSDETLKAVGPFYLVYARGSKISHTGGKCVTCRGLHILT